MTYKRYAIYGSVKIATIALQDSLIYKNIEFLSPRLLHYRLLQITISKANILPINKKREVYIYFNRNCDQ